MQPNKPKDPAELICDQIVKAIANNISSSDGYGGLTCRGQDALKAGLLQLVDFLRGGLGKQKPAESDDKAGPVTQDGDQPS